MMGWGLVIEWGYLIELFFKFLKQKLTEKFTFVQFKIWNKTNSTEKTEQRDACTKSSPTQRRLIFTCKTYQPIKYKNNSNDNFKNKRELWTKIIS